jgi:hypothetical protein
MALEDGASEEVAVTGNEGLIGVSAFLEHGRGGAPPRRSVVQHAGHALRLPGRFVAEQFDRDGEFQRVLLRYTQALITQVAQTVVCNRHHRIAQQLCRWLLLRLDRLPVGEINATQERIAALLGVRHEGITAAVADLLRVPTHDGHGSEPMADTIPTAWRTAFRWHGGQSGGRPGTVSAMISERWPPSPGRVR